MPADCRQWSLLCQERAARNVQTALFAVADWYLARVSMASWSIPARLSADFRRIFRYKVVDRDMHGQPLPSVYHRHKSSLSLRGCYVYSGRLAAHLLSPHSGSSWDPADAQHNFPRMYPQDKLRVTDDEEDCTLVIFKRPFGGSGRFGKAGRTRVLRARSQVRSDD